MPTKIELSQQLEYKVGGEC